MKVVQRKRKSPHSPWDGPPPRLLAPGKSASPMGDASSSSSSSSSKTPVSNVGTSLSLTSPSIHTSPLAHASVKAPWGEADKEPSVASSSSDSPLRTVVTCMKDLPSLSEVKAACDCYADECGDSGTCLQLCYASRALLDDLWLQLCSMQISKLQLAFLYTVIACVGVGTPVGHPRYRLEALRSPTSQAKYIRNAMVLLREQTEPEPPKSFSRCHLLALLCWYHQCAGIFDVAWMLSKEANAAARACNLYQPDEWANATPGERFTIKILQIDLAFMSNWLAYSQEREGSSSDLPTPVVVARPSDSFEQARLNHKILCSILACKLSSECRKCGQLSKQELEERALQLDDEILAHIDSFPLLREVPPLLHIDPSNRQAVRLAETIFIFRAGTMYLRSRMMFAFSKHHPVDLFQHTALSSARTTLQMLPLVQNSLDSPWQSVVTRSWIDGFFNDSMFIFLSTIQTQLYQSPSLAASTGSNLHTRSIYAELVWFMTNFDQLLDGMDKLGFVRPPLMQCAMALKKTPVQRPFAASAEDDGQHEKPTASMPFVKVTDEDDGDEAKRTACQEPVHVLRETHEDHTIFKAAYSVHSVRGDLH